MGSSSLTARRSSLTPRPARAPHEQQPTNLRSRRRPSRLLPPPPPHATMVEMVRTSSPPRRATRCRHPENSLTSPYRASRLLSVPRRSTATLRRPPGRRRGRGGRKEGRKERKKERRGRRERRGGGVYGQFVARRSPFAASSPRPILAPPPHHHRHCPRHSTAPQPSLTPPHHPPLPGAAQPLRYGALRSRSTVTLRRPQERKEREKRRRCVWAVRRSPLAARRSRPGPRGLLTSSSRQIWE